MGATAATDARARDSALTIAQRGRARERVVSSPLLYALSAAVYAAVGTVFQVYPPFLEDLEREFRLGRTAAGLSMTLFLAPVALVSPLLGAAVDRRGCAPVGRVGFVLLLAGGAVTAAAPSFALLLTGRVVAGLGGAMALVAVLQLLAASVPAERLGIAFGVFIAGLPIGTGIAFNLLNRLPSWRASMLAALTLAALVGAAYALLVPAGAGVAARRSLRKDLGVILARPALRQLALLVLLGYTAIVAFTTWRRPASSPMRGSQRERRP